MNRLGFRIMSALIAFALVWRSNSHAAASAMSSPSMLTSNTYYVSTTGSDSNSGSSAAPFRTFTKAASVLVAGDTLQVMTGTYTETLTLANSGTATAPITVIGNSAVLNMQGTKANGISISGNHIKVSRFEVVGATDFGILVTGKYVSVENNVIHDNVTRNGVGTCGISTSWGSALKVKVGGENTTIRSNSVYDNCGEGIAVTRGLTALIENNTVYDNFSVNIYIDNSAFVTVRNNISYCTGTHLNHGNRATGIALGEEFYTGWGAQLHDIQISSNTITDCRTGVAAFESEVAGTLMNATINNNNVPSGQVRGVSIQTLLNQNVSISNNTLFNSIYMAQPIGITLTGNIIGGVVPTSTGHSFPTSTNLPATFAPTAILSTATKTASPLPASATAAQTLISLTPTASAIPASATATPSQTATATAIPPTSTFTASPVPASPTFTSTSIPPTVTSAPTGLARSEAVFDDKLSSFVYSSGWQDTIRKQAYGGSYKITSQNGSHVTFPFTGQSFSVIYKGGPAFQKMDVYVDSILVGAIDQRASGSGFQLRWDYPGLLTPGGHTLKLVFVAANTSDGANGSLDAVIVR